MDMKAHQQAKRRHEMWKDYFLVNRNSAHQEESNTILRDLHQMVDYVSHLRQENEWLLQQKEPIFHITSAALGLIAGIFLAAAVIIFKVAH